MSLSVTPRYDLPSTPRLQLEAFHAGQRAETSAMLVEEVGVTPCSAWGLPFFFFFFFFFGVRGARGQPTKR